MWLNTHCISVKLKPNYDTHFYADTHKVGKTKVFPVYNKNIYLLSLKAIVATFGILLSVGIKTCENA